MNQPTITIQFGAPVTEPPTPAGRAFKPAEHWVKVANMCKNWPGLWVPVTVSGLGRDRLRAVPAEIKRGQLAAFRQWPGFEARFVNETLYVRYRDPDAITAATIAPETVNA